jgi:hypothetical protein
VQGRHQCHLESAKVFVLGDQRPKKEACPVTFGTVTVVLGRPPGADRGRSLAAGMARVVVILMTSWGGFQGTVALEFGEKGGLGEYGVVVMKLSDSCWKKDKQVLQEARGLILLFGALWPIQLLSIGTCGALWWGLSRLSRPSLAPQPQKPPLPSHPSCHSSII